MNIWFIFSFMSSTTLPPIADSAARILQVARRHFERFGYRRAAIAEIAREAGVAAGTIYRHYESKLDLLREVLHDANAEWLEHARAAPAGPGTALERLARQGAASIEFHKRDSLMSAVLRRDTDMIFAPLLEEEHARLLAANVDMNAEVIREGIAEGSIRADLDPEKVAYVLFTAGQTLFNQEVHPYADVQPVFAQMVMEGLLPR